MNSYRYTLVAKYEDLGCYGKRVGRFCVEGVVVASTPAEATAKATEYELSRNSKITEVLEIRTQKMEHPVSEHGKIVFSFEYDFTARDERERDQVVNRMYDYWYADQDEELYDALVGDIGKKVAEAINLKITNATVEIE